MAQSPVLKNGLNALLTPKESVLVLIDHQAFQFANLHSHEPTMIVNNVVALAKTAKVFNVPTILTTVVEDRGGKLIKGLQDVFPEQKPIDRTWINTWEDARVVHAAVGRCQGGDHDHARALRRCITAAGLRRPHRTGWIRGARARCRTV